VWIRASVGAFWDVLGWSCFFTWLIRRISVPSGRQLPKGPLSLDKAPIFMGWGGRISNFLRRSCALSSLYGFKANIGSKYVFRQEAWPGLLLAGLRHFKEIGLVLFIDCRNLWSLELSWPASREGPKVPGIPRSSIVFAGDHSRIICWQPQQITGYIPYFVVLYLPASRLTLFAYPIIDKLFILLT